jgi:hypothetical protein
MVAGGKPLWYLQVFTTFSTLVFTIFFTSVCLSWSGGLANVSRPKKFPEDDWEATVEAFIIPFRTKLSASLLWFNLSVGLLTTIGGAIFGYLLYRRRIKLFYSWIWFGLVCAFTIVWMSTSIILSVEVSDLASRFDDPDYEKYLTGSLSSIYSWGKRRSSATIIGLIVFPTILYLFLSFVAYRLYVKLEIFGNENPENLRRDYAPGDWVERKKAAEGGTWHREEESMPLVVKPDIPVPENNETTANTFSSEGMRQRKSPPIFEGDYGEESNVVSLESVKTNVLTGGPNRADSLTDGWGNWLEDVFDYTF